MSTPRNAPSQGLKVVHVARDRGSAASRGVDLMHLDESGWRDIRHAEIVLPAQYRGDDRMDWARQRSMLWTLAEYSEDVKEARVARAYIANLPASVGQDQQLHLARGFAQSLADRFGNAVDFAVHAPHPGRTGAAHVHFLASAREVQLDGFGRITLAASHHQARRIRELWLDHQAEAGLAATIEPQAKAGQGAEHATRTRAIASWLQLKARLNPSMTRPERDTAHAPKSDHDHSR